MSRMAFVGDKDEVFDGRLPATNSYPTLSVAEFQGLFHFLSNETENGMLHRLGLARITVHQELAAAVAKHGSLDALSLHWFGDSAAGIVLYKQAVFSLAAHNVIGNKLSTDATAEAADRQEALQSKAEHCLVQYRQAVDLLLNGKPMYTFEVV